MPWMDLVEAINHDPPTKKEIEEVIDYRRRKAKPKFYADENFPTAAMMLIRSGGCNVLTANEVELQGHPDENHAAYAVPIGKSMVMGQNFWAT